MSQSALVKHLARKSRGTDYIVGHSPTDTPNRRRRGCCTASRCPSVRDAGEPSAIQGDGRMRVFENQEDEMDRNILDLAASEQMLEWLDVSRQNAVCAVLLSEKHMKREALLHAQQSAETATKALALGVGMSYDEVKKSSHDNLNLACAVLDGIVKNHIYITPLIGNLIEDDALKTLDGVLRATNRKLKTDETYEFKASMQVASPAEVEAILDLLDNLDANIASRAPTVTEKIIAEVSSLEREEGNTPSLISQLVKVASGYWEGEPGKFVPDAVEETSNLIFGKSLESIEGANLRYEDFDVDSVSALLKRSIAMVKLFEIGGLVWPHQPAVRYPPPPDAPDDPKEAARQGKLGWKHYTDEIGVIRHVQRLSESLSDAVETLSEPVHPSMDG